MNYMPDLLPRVRYMPSGHVVAVAIAATLIFLLYKVPAAKILFDMYANIQSCLLVPMSPISTVSQKYQEHFQLPAISPSSEMIMQLCAKSGGVSMVTPSSKFGLEIHGLSLSALLRIARRSSFQTPKD